MNSPDWQLLHTLVAIAQSRTFSEAAQRLGVSPGALSFRMKQLERDSPSALFVWKGKKKVLTAYGLQLAATAQRGLEDLGQELTRLHRQFSEPSLLTLRVAARAEVCEYMMPGLQFPGQLEFHALSSDEAHQALVDRKIDVAFLYKLPDSSEFVSKKIFRSQNLLLIPKKGASVGRNLVRNPDFLKTHPCVRYGTEREPLAHLCAALGISTSALSVKAVSEDWAVVTECVRQGLGYAVVPSYVLTQAASLENVQRIPVPVDLVPGFQYCAVFPKELLKIPAYAKTLREMKAPE